MTATPHGGRGEAKIGIKECGVFPFKKRARDPRDTNTVRKGGRGGKSQAKGNLVVILDPMAVTPSSETSSWSHCLEGGSGEE